MRERGYHVAKENNLPALIGEGAGPASHPWLHKQEHLIPTCETLDDFFVVVVDHPLDMLSPDGSSTQVGRGSRGPDCRIERRKTS